MAKETMAGKKKRQRAGKAKGLYDNVGSYGNKKSLNLRNKQLGKKGVAASKKRTVSISKTEHMKEGPHKGKVVGPKGNPLTGKVDMGGGNMAVYRNGKRVTAKRPKGGNTNPGGGNTTTNPPSDGDAKTGLTAAQKTKMRKGAKASQAISKGGMSKSQAAAAALSRGTKPASAKSSSGSPASRVPKAGSKYPRSGKGQPIMVNGGSGRVKTPDVPRAISQLWNKSPVVAPWNVKSSPKQGDMRKHAFPGQGTKTNGKGLRWQRWNNKTWVTGGLVKKGK